MRWAAVTPRFMAHEFRSLSTYGQLDGCSLIDWPLTLAEIEPYYDRAEKKMGVSGTNGLPPSFRHNNYQVMEAGGRKVGYREITSTRMAINSASYDGRPACRQLAFCFSGCKLGAKWSTLYTEVPKAEATGHFELRPECMALRIEHDGSGRVTGVVYRDAEGRRQLQRARGVAVAGNVVETTRLLLNSDSSAFPQGLGNDSGHVGRNYMRHMTSIVVALMPGRVNMHKGSRQTGIILDEQYHDASRGFAGGYIIEAAASDPASMISFYTGWGEPAAEFMEQYTRQACSFVTGEDPPQSDNRIELHPTQTDDNGLPVPVLHYAMHPNTVAMQNHANRQTAAIYESLGGDVRVKTEGPVIGCHNMGTARMSDRAADGVTNRWGQVHGVPNLFVSDGSLFSTSGAANPTLTIVALAIRQAEHVVRRLARKEL
ncbi:MAG: GMC family oxidoreductase, partial [Thiohalobacterales bacterium]|nr:GMC family oxidoreductase [Thiohalobacterales bacterium]